MYNIRISFLNNSIEDYEQIYKITYQVKSWNARKQDSNYIIEGDDTTQAT